MPDRPVVRSKDNSDHGGLCDHRRDFSDNFHRPKGGGVFFSIKFHQSHGHFFPRRFFFESADEIHFVLSIPGRKTGRNNKEEFLFIDLAG